MLDKEKFEKDMIAFHQGKHNDALVYFEELTRLGYTFNDTKEYLRLLHEEYLNTNERRRAQTRILQKTCSECFSKMVLLEVNKNKATMTGDYRDKCVWFCRNCGESEFIQKPIQEVYKEMGGT